MAKADATGQMDCTITAKVIRADGTEENLGVVSATSADAEALEKLIRKLKPSEEEQAAQAPGAMTLEEVNALTAQRAEEADRATEEARQQSPMTELLGGEG